MKKNLAILISDDFFSDYSFLKLNDKYNLFPFSFSESKKFNSFIVKDANFYSFFDFIKKNKIEFIFFAGKVKGSLPFENLHSTAKNFLSQIGRLKPEEIMKKIVDFLESYGLKVLPQTEVFKEEIAEDKVYTFPLNEQEIEDVKYGFSVLKDILKYQIGQSIILKNGMILGVEGIEGTDEFIKRIGNYVKDFVFVKGCSDDKDLRFDLPTIGMETIKNIKKTFGRVIAIKAEKTIILEKEKVIEECKKNNIKLIGIK
ncbi:MAG: LpxI family protein [Candidatus Omnitrophica bacterium]|nr:LpxI family protein [Candidatus Omnitrophota bacterium]MCM8809694.1 LpxI family protein [Candidatus Omnitrophota bacterium]MCM8810366.1 LpxI family protein [Candidatus Omnitrophota bacterium]